MTSLNAVISKHLLATWLKSTPVGLNQSITFIPMTALLRKELGKLLHEHLEWIDSNTEGYAENYCELSPFALLMNENDEFYYYYHRGVTPMLGFPAKIDEEHYRCIVTGDILKPSIMIQNALHVMWQNTLSDDPMILKPSRFMGLIYQESHPQDRCPKLGMVYVVRHPPGRLHFWKDEPFRNVAVLTHDQESHLQPTESGLNIWDKDNWSSICFNHREFLRGA